VHDEDQRLAAATADAFGSDDVGRQVHRVSLHAPQTVAPDRRQRARDGSVVEQFGRLARRVAEFDSDAVPLPCADAFAGGVQLEALFGLVATTASSSARATAMPCAANAASNASTRVQPAASSSMPS
jgi:hypothetical protein